VTSRGAEHDQKPSGLAPSLLVGDEVDIADGAEIGANVVIHAGTRIGRSAVIQDGAVVGKLPRLGPQTSSRP
jgi:UDP-3-O-[3-hydroxymyristoyl] glucosamine N-acyltransferase